MKVRHISLLGHKDHGKSTLIGSLLIQTGAATQVRVNEAIEYSKRLHKAFEPAFILDSFAEEREQGMTYDTTRAEIKYKDMAFELIDVPGHEELIKNMITGASYGELAVLLVSAKPGEGIMDQTKRHLFLASMLGIRKIVVAVNKMDTIRYDKEKFETIESNIERFLRAIGYNNHEIAFVPISAYNAENIVKKSTIIRWYKGKSLLDTVYSMLDDDRKAGHGKLRVVIQGTIGEGKGKLTTGKVISGELHVGEKVKVIQDNSNYIIKGLFVKGTKSRNAKTGENVAIKFDREAKDARGSVIYGSSDKLQSSSKIKAVIFLTRRLGKKMAIRFNGNSVNAKITVRNAIDTVTGKEPHTKTTKPLGAARVDIKLGKPLPIEPFEKIADLGRFTIYEGKEFSGIGIVK